jgi:membrane-bound metal-dependent hydrolase YbcI (DUF457 family)
MSYSHAPSGAAAWLPVGTALGLPVPVNLGLAAVAAVSALLPDMDHPSAFLPRAIPGGRIIARAIGNAAGGHRQATHYLSTTVPVTLLAWWTAFMLSQLTPRPLTVYGAGLVAAAVGLGYAVHILGDYVTLGRFPILGPFSKRRYALRLFRVGGTVENLVVAPALGFAVVWQVWLLIGPTVTWWAELLRASFTG